MKFAKATKFHRKSGEGLGDGSPRLWSAGGAALPTFGVPRLRRSDDCGIGVPALPGWAEVWLPALRAWVRFEVYFRVPIEAPEWRPVGHFLSSTVTAS
jgi:hypothetical protein